MLTRDTPLTALQVARVLGWRDQACLDWLSEAQVPCKRLPGKSRGSVRYLWGDVWERLPEELEEQPPAMEQRPTHLRRAAGWDL